MDQSNRTDESIDKKIIETNSSHLKSYFILTVENFKDLVEDTRSPEFKIGDSSKWVIKIMPKYMKDDIEYVSVFLSLIESSRLITKAKYRLSIINANNQVLNKRITGTNDYKINHDWGYLCFIRRDELSKDSSDLLSNNNLKLHFIIDLIDEKQDININNRLVNDLKKMINNEEFSDFVFKVEEKKLYAHKIFLTIRSKVFRAMFTNDVIENQTNECVINDIEYEVFEQLLSFVYTGKSPKVESMAPKLLAAAEKYEIMELKDICQDIIFRDISIENAIQTLTIADKYNATKIMDKVIEFIVFNRFLIFNNSDIDLENFIVDNPKLILKLLKVDDRKPSLMKCKISSRNRNWIYGNF